ncbi:MAG: hypothetical protein J07HQX50_00064 [Haloquadratum sp. J07HQX50]|nr:MAG: hypothetical protein J07HQX50_00064 [Haloquadratum sp. J07HQX50]
MLLVSLNWFAHEGLERIPNRICIFKRIKQFVTKQLDISTVVIIGVVGVVLFAGVFLCLSQNNSQSSGLNYETETGHDDGISINTDSAAELTEHNREEFVLEGSFITGSSTCSRASIENLKLKQDSTAHVMLAPEKVRKRACTEDLASDSYRLHVDHEGRVETVRITITQTYHDTLSKEIKLDED